MAPMALPRFRQLAHTADVRLAVWGADEAELLANAVAGALRCALDRAPRGRPRRWVAVARWPHALPDRLVRAVNEALFHLYVRRELAVAVRCTARGAALGLAPLPAGRSPVTEVKAATFHALRPVTSPRLSALLTLDL
jgi:SHS2 domain-containing protein